MSLTSEYEYSIFRVFSKWKITLGLKCQSLCQSILITECLHAVGIFMTAEMEWLYGTVLFHDADSQTLA